VTATNSALCKTARMRRTWVCPERSAHRLVRMLARAAVTANAALSAPAKAYEPVVSLTSSTSASATMATGRRASAPAAVKATTPGWVSAKR